ncbi:MAG: hypothetical protein ACRCSF_01935 [Mycobacteriaceae bacterium]
MPTNELTTRCLRQLRGGLIGLSSGAASLAAHGWGGGQVTTESNALTLLTAVNIALGVIVTSIPLLHKNITNLTISLLCGQFSGHIVLASISTVEHHHSDQWLSLQMFCSHLAMSALLALGIHATYRGWQIAVSALARIIPRITRSWPEFGLHYQLLTPYHFYAIPELLCSSGTGTRGPPLP